MSTVALQAKPNGSAVAAYLAAAFGLLVLGIVVLVTYLSADAQTFVFNVGKVWVPNAQGIGPYSGKETFLLVGWLGSWAALHFSLRHRIVNTRVWFGVALAAVLLSLALVWPPVWHLVKGT